MAKKVLLDTGPLVSLIDRSESTHEECVRAFDDLTEPVVTTEPVLTEAMHLLSFDLRAQRACLAYFLRRAVVVVPSDVDGLARVDRLIAKYRDVPMDFADASLVVLAEDLGTDRVFTLDRRGFGTYRAKGRTPFRILP